MQGIWIHIQYNMNMWKVKPSHTYASKTAVSTPPFIEHRHNSNHQRTRHVLINKPLHLYLFNFVKPTNNAKTQLCKLNFPRASHCKSFDFPASQLCRKVDISLQGCTQVCETILMHAGCLQSKRRDTQNATAVKYGAVLRLECKEFLLPYSIKTNTYSQQYI